MTTAKRQARWRARKKLRDSGLEEVKDLWAPAYHHEPIRQYAEKLRTKGEMPNAPTKPAKHQTTNSGETKA